MNKKRILLIATGGTIACKKSENGLTPQMDGKELLQYVKEVEQYSIVDTITLFFVDSTNINYPIVKSDNNEFYLNHNINKSYDSSGWTFMDYRNNSDLSDSNTIFYGHNLINKTSFGSVSNMFAVYYSEPDSSYLQTNYDNKIEYLDFLNMLKEKK